MTRIAWLTDIHLNFAAEPQIASFLDRVNEQRPDAVLLSGDIAESSDVGSFLCRLQDAFGVPLYFVLGNHDFYYGSIARVRGEIQSLATSRPGLTYLTAAGACELAPGIGLVGHDGWADGRLGDYERSLVMMNDYRLIHELSGLSKLDRLVVLQRFGDEAGAHLQAVLPDALARFEHVFVLTHVPPMREACWYAGQISDDAWAPHFTCKAAGDAIRAALKEFPNRRITVLCGHTHSPGIARPMDKLTIYTGSAEYGRPEVQQVWDLAAV
jgi:Icc protein